MKGHLEQASAGTRNLVALDCGAGVGRVTNEFLIHYFQEVDLLEPSKPLLQCAEKSLRPGSKRLSRVPPGNKVVNFYNQGLQQHIFEEGRYDCIWIQWCLLYLTDADVIDMFHRARHGLTADGLIFVKENVCSKTGFVVDNDDSSLTRSNAYFVDLFERSNMQLLQSARQKHFPKDLFEVWMYVLKPKS
jgi:protein N-terminal methyltransferase